MDEEGRKQGEEGEEKRVGNWQERGAPGWTGREGAD